jgi:hypothetical protein
MPIINGINFRCVPQKAPGKPVEKATHKFIVDPDFFPYDVRRDTINAFLFVGTEEELEDFCGEASDKWATVAPLKYVKTAVKFYGICRTIKLYTDNFGDFVPFRGVKGEFEYNDDKFWRQLFYMLIHEALIIKEIGDWSEPGVSPEKAAKVVKEYEAAKAAKAAKAAEDWEVDVPPEAVGDVMKMFEKMAAGGA